MEFRPCIDLHEGKVKQIVGATLQDKAGAKPVTNFETNRSPAEYAKLYAADGLRGGHVVMLGAGNEQAAVAALQAYPQGMQVGGGITPHNARFYLDAGASHVIVTSYVFHEGRVDFTRLEEMRSLVGKERLVLDLSCRKQGEHYYVVTDRWQKFTTFEISQAHLAKLSAYCDEFLIHAVDVEGMRQGVEQDLLKMLGEWSPIPTTYAGGATTLEDLELVKKFGQGRIHVTIGSALDIFGGQLHYRDVLQWFAEQA